MPPPDRGENTTVVPLCAIGRATSSAELASHRVRGQPNGSSLSKPCGDCARQRAIAALLHAPPVSCTETPLARSQTASGYKRSTTRAIAASARAVPPVANSTIARNGPPRQQRLAVVLEHDSPQILVRTGKGCQRYSTRPSVGWINPPDHPQQGRLAATRCPPRCTLKIPFAHCEGNVLQNGHRLDPAQQRCTIAGRPRAPSRPARLGPRPLAQVGNRPGAIKESGWINRFLSMSARARSGSTLHGVGCNRGLETRIGELCLHIRRLERV